MTELIAFFSRGEENYVNGEIRTLEKGNTEAAAGMIQKFTGADLFKIEPQQAYSADYNECTAQAQADQRRNAGRSWLRIRRAWNRMMSLSWLSQLTGDDADGRYFTVSWNI